MVSYSEAEIQRVQRIRGHGGRIFRIAWSKSSDHLIHSASEDKTIRMWNVSTREENQKSVHSPNTRCVDWSSNGRWFATDSSISDKDVRIRNLENATLLWDDPLHDEKVTCLAWSPD